jgi:hypothetical protein
VINIVIHSVDGSHPVVSVTKQTALIHSDTPQVYFNSVGCLYTRATCFGLYLGHHQVCQYKTLTKEDTIRIDGAPFLQSIFIMSKHNIYN